MPIAKAPYDVDTIFEEEISNQDQGKTGSGPLNPAFIKKGPAASHQAGNPTSGGGINRPTKGRS